MLASRSRSRILRITALAFTAVMTTTTSTVSAKEVDSQLGAGPDAPTECQEAALRRTLSSVSRWLDGGSAITERAAGSGRLGDLQVLLVEGQLQSAVWAEEGSDGLGVGVVDVDLVAARLAGRVGQFVDEHAGNLSARRATLHDTTGAGMTASWPSGRPRDG